MIENPFVKKIVQGVLRNRKQSLLDRSIMHPSREWFSGLVAGFVVLGLGVAWGVSTYVQFSNISVSSENSEEENVIYRESLVETALTDFAERKKEYELLKQTLLSKQQVVETVVLPVVVEEVATTTEPETEAPSTDVEDSIEEEVSSEAGAAFIAP